MATPCTFEMPARVSVLPPPFPFGKAVPPVPVLWDEDARERMIVERAMRPRSWERLAAAA